MDQVLPTSKSTPKGSILVVEDSPDLLTLISEALSIEGHSITAVRNGVEAMAFLAANPAPDLVLCDLVMPDMNGGELIRRLRENKKWATTRVIVISGANKVGEKAAAAGADSFLAKPFDIDKLYSSVSRELLH